MMNKRAKQVKLIAVIAGFLSGHSFAATAIQTSLSAGSGWFIAAELSEIWAKFANTMLINNGSPYAFPYSMDQYTLAPGNSQTSIAFLAGYKWLQNYKWITAISMALRYQRFLAQGYDGQIMQYSLPQFKNYSYNWSFSSDLFALYSKIHLREYGPFTPFFDVGFGMAMNHAQNFHEWALAGVTPRISPDFQNHTHTNMAYSLGIGVDFAMSKDLSFSLGYDYQYLGRMASGYGRTTWSGERLNLGTYKGSMVTLVFHTW